MRRVLALAAPLACAALFTGCGGGGGKSASSTTVPATTAPASSQATTAPASTAPATTAASTGSAQASGDPTAGKAVFASAGCGSCHTLKAAGSNGQVGPNLDSVQPDVALVVDRVEHGAGPMPSFKGRLSAQDIANVAAFVFKSTH